jgi:hypothetical protein
MKILYKRADGGISIVSPIISQDEGDLTIDDAVKRCLSRVEIIPPTASKVTVAKEVNVLHGDVFRDAWCDIKSDNSISIDMQKAKSIVVENIKSHINKHKKMLSISMELNEDLSEIKSKIKQLSDRLSSAENIIVSGIDDLQGLEKLKALIVN